MSADAKVEPSAEDWVARFVALARRMGMATVEPDPNRLKGAPLKLPEEKLRATEELGAILPLLRAHLTQAQIDQLLLDDDPDVRLAATTTLGAKNDELRLSAIKSALRGLSMSEVLANRQRARSKPPRSPRVEDMNTDELVARFVDAGERKSLADRFLNWGTNKADRKTCGKRLREMSEAETCLKSRAQLDELLPLMDSENQTVRLGAAIARLGIDEAKAITVLEDISKNGGLMERGDAGLTLRVLRSKSSGRDGAPSPIGKV